jgi:hypothetical protein
MPGVKIAIGAFAGIQMPRLIYLMVKKYKSQDLGELHQVDCPGELFARRFRVTHGLRRFLVIAARLILMRGNFAER